MAPEQFAGAAVDARTDIYALGVLFFEMLTGRLPFDGDSAQIMYGHLQQPPPAPRAIVPSLPPAVERLVLRMLAKDPAARPQSAAEIAAALQASQSDQPATGPTIALAQPVAPTIVVRQAAPTEHADARPRNGSGRTIGIAALLLVVGAAALVLARIATFGIAPPTAANSTPAGETRELPTRAPEAAPTAPATGIAGPTTGAADLPTDAPRSTAELRDVGLQRVGAARLDKVAFSGPESFGVGNLSVGKVGDALWFFGEVRNDGAESREAVEVRVILRDSAGKEIASQTGFAHLSYLKPGEISSFNVLFNDNDAPAPKYADYTIEVRSRKADFQPRYTVRDLRVGDDLKVGRDTLGFLGISGRVYNDGEAPAKFVHLHAVFYDAGGAVVGVADTFATTGEDKIVPAGADAPFELQAIIFTGDPVRYRLFAQASKAN
jgi:protein kinase-like protein